MIGDYQTRRASMSGPAEHDPVWCCDNCELISTTGDEFGDREDLCGDCAKKFEAEAEEMDQEIEAFALRTNIMETLR